MRDSRRWWPRPRGHRLPARERRGGTVGRSRSDTRLWGSRVDEVPVRGGDELLALLLAEGIAFFTVGLGRGPRAKLLPQAWRPDCNPSPPFIPRAIISSRASIAAGGQVFAAVINPGATIGENCVINTGAIIEHDCTLARHVHVASGACLAGGGDGRGRGVHRRRQHHSAGVAHRRGCAGRRGRSGVKARRGRRHCRRQCRRAPIS